METNVWEMFDEEIDVEGLINDIKSTSTEATFEEVPHGEYEVCIDKMGLVSSKAGNPMLSVWFKILQGDFKNNRIFYNQVITKGFQIHLANEFLHSLDSGVEVDFKNYKQYGNLIMDIAEAIDGKFEYALKYSSGKNGFSNYKIVDVFEVI